ncbi:hypothetical protein OOK13_14445 [Streptomyces sp. NBC_00378]|uniref:hypothetical protein n=1 Tax=unclassified Streptomyces TaxID=2593676 RepID=UPI002250149D|nr:MULTISPECIES: hypothetical protein [unclassified Streptomyces]MCX5109718.1 hypothetical protein [Streptomyces sp. NBC_00378]
MNRQYRIALTLAAAGSAIGLSVTAAYAAPSAGWQEPTKVSNGYGHASFKTDGDVLTTCDDKTDGKKVRASVQKWYASTGSWQAVGANDAPASACDSKVVDVEPDSSLCRIHIWAEDGGVKVSGSDRYGPEFNATP